VRKYIAFAALFGFLIALFWMILGFLLFNGPNGRIADLYYLGGKLVCPVFPVTSANNAYGPFLNASIYALAMWIILRLKKSFQSSSRSS